MYVCEMRVCENKMKDMCVCVIYVIIVRLINKI